MVLATNEWLNNCDDAQKSATSATTTATNNAEPTVAASAGATAAETNTETTSTTSLTDVAPQASEAVLTTNNANIEEACNQETTLTNDGAEDDGEFLQPTSLDLPVHMHRLKIIAESSSHDTTPEISAESLNNNQEIIKVHILEDKINIPNLNSSLNIVIKPNSNANSNENSNTNTLQPSLQLNARPLQTTQAQTSNPITPQALSSALHSALMHAAVSTPASLTTTTTTAATPTTNNFLSSLGIGSVNATLSLPTAKQLNANFLTSEINSTTNANPESTGAENMRQAKIVLLCETNSHPFETRTIHLMPNIECKVGRLIAKSKAAETNAIFDCKVLSRTHAVLWYSDDGKFWVKDTKSSNGTFINESKLGTDAAELHFGDVVKFGVDVLENSRKEVHGCIIARVKLYYPDGRETITIDASAVNAELSPNSADAIVSYEDLQRLNIFMQETTQREKVLKSKLFNIQNMLDATRKNSSLCWQSLISEDQLLHRIHSLEKKLQCMEKNVPESVLRNEVLKLLDDKISYQNTAKEALRKVYQERCEAMQSLAKMEAAYTTADNECKILRDQIMNTKQSLKDVNKRLLCLEAEYVLFKSNNENQQQEAKEQQEQRHSELLEQLQQRELECEGLRQKINELLHKHSDLIDDEQLQKQAFDKLDSVIADMDLGDDDDDDDDDEDDAAEDFEIGSQAKVAQAVNDHVEAIIKKSHKKAKAKSRAGIKNGAIFSNSGNNKTSSSSSSDDSEKEKTLPGVVQTHQQLNETSQGIAKESTIMKWLQNSDLNQKEGSRDIFNAICNDSDSSEEMLQDASGGSVPINAIKSNKASNSFTRKCLQFKSKLHSVQNNLKQLEVEIESETNGIDVENVDSGFVSCDTTVDEKDQYKSSNKNNDMVLSKRNKTYMLLKSSVSMLREVYNEICDNAKQIETVEEEDIEDDDHISYDDTRLSISLSSLTARTNKTDTDPETVRLASKEQSMLNLANQQQQKLESEISGYQEKIALLEDKLEQAENDSHTLEIMQIECDTLRDKIADITKVNETLRDENQSLEKSAILKSGNPATMESNPDAAFEQIVREDLETINCGDVQREEELIMYKEQLEQSQLANAKLAVQIDELKQMNNIFPRRLLFHALPYCIAVVAAMFFFLMHYF